MTTLHQTKSKLRKLANQLFEITPKELTEDVELNGDFDYIKSDVHGVVSFSPKQQVTLDNLNYQRDEQGRDYFSIFLTIAVQAGVYMGFEQKQKELDEMTKNYENEREYAKEIREDYSDSIKQLRLNQMPSGELSDEIIKLREEISKLKKENQELSAYKTKVVELTNYFKLS